MTAHAARRSPLPRMVVFLLLVAGGLIGGMASDLDLLSFPIGTAIGAYSIWALVQDETPELFDSKFG